jgi:hypothetical protein
MATAQQYEVFKALFDEESERYHDLMDRAKTFISVITLFSGVLVLKGSDLKEYLDGSAVSRWSFVAGVALFICALVSLLLAIRLRPYIRFDDPEEIVTELPDEGLSEEEFLDDRMGRLAYATNNNAECNDQLAKALEVSSRLLVTATAAVLVSVVGRVI